MTKKNTKPANDINAKPEKNPDASLALSEEQMEALLNALEIPARLCGRHGSIVAQNRLASGLAAAALWDDAERIEQSGGCTLLLLRHKANNVTAPSAQEDIGTLANGMAHSIRNPLSSIITAASLVNDDPNVSEETIMLLEVITKESRHLNQILTDFLSYVRPHPAQVSRFDLCEALQGTVKVLRQDGLLHEKILIEESLPPELWVEGDESQLRQALWNIIRNAGEAMPNGGTLSLEGEDNGDTIRLAVSDTGRGFSEKEMARAFDPFFSNTSEGTGLGLTVARSTLTAMKGSIHIENKPATAGVESSERGGASIVLQLPLALDSA